MEHLLGFFNPYNPELAVKANDLVENNPLINLETIKHHCGVLVKGQWLSREECDKILVELKEKNNGASYHYTLCHYA